MYNDRPLKVSICVTVDEDIIERLKQLSIADSRSFSQYINLVLRRHIEASENKKQ
jgi:post-segregation antitoxin (ccd killing protein)